VSTFFVHFLLPLGHRIRWAFSLKNVVWAVFFWSLRSCCFLPSPTGRPMFWLPSGPLRCLFFLRFFAPTRRVRCFFFFTFFFSLLLLRLLRLLLLLLLSSSLFCFSFFSFFVSFFFFFLFFSSSFFFSFLFSSFLFSSSGANVLATKQTNEEPSPLRNYTTSLGTRKKALRLARSD
jgi:hypothetical protein